MAQQQLATQKLIVTQNELRASMAKLGSMPISAKPLAVNAESLISGLNVNSSVIDQQKVKSAVDAVTNAHRAQQGIMNQEIATQNELNALKDKELGRQQSLYDFSIRQREIQQQQSSQLIRQQMQEEANLEAERLKTAELQRQIGLYQQQNSLQLRNLQSQYGSLARNPAVQSQISAVQSTVGGLSSSVLDANGFRTQTSAINSSISSIRTGLNEARASSQGFGSDLANNAIKMVQWTIVGGLIFGTLRQIKEGFSFINDLDKSMTNIQMITGRSRDSVMEMTKVYADLATQLHSTTAEVMKSAEEFLRAGHNQEETMKLIQASTVMGAIAGQDQKSSADQLIAITNAYKMNAEESMNIVDKLTTVDNMSATSTKELGDALERTSVSAQMAGTSFSDLVSYIGTVSSISRKSASSIGESFKTIFSR